MTALAEPIALPIALTTAGGIITWGLCLLRVLLRGKEEHRTSGAALVPTLVVLGKSAVL